MRIAMIGVGYVGLVSGTCLSEMGHHVICLDVNPKKVKELNQGIIPIYEPGLEELVKRNTKGKRLFFTLDAEAAISQSDIIFIAVDTPPLPDGRADTTRIEAVADTISIHLKDGQIIVTKSTVPPGTTFKIKERILERLKENGLSIPFEVVSNPEFLKEGSAVQDFMKPDRVIVGTESENAATVMKELYAPFMLSHDRLFVMDILSAELCKYACNGMLATRISFMNELSLISEALGADIQEIRKGMGADQRIGFRFLYPGAGFGGSCLPKDVRALRAEATSMGCPTPLLDSVEEINERQKRRIGEKIISYFESRGGLKDKKIAIWGLSFKPNTDDMREAPSITLIQMLLQQGATVSCFDPIAMENAKRILPDNPNLIFCPDELTSAENADAVALMTEWQQFRLFDMESLLRTMKGRAFFDGRNQYKPHDMIAKGFDYYCIGYNHPQHSFVPVT